jgi:two-component system, sensor histidine kinase and response regulator
MLIHWDMKPEAVGDVPAALAKIHEAASANRPFPLLIVDALIPQIDGFTLAGWIKNNPKLVRATILMVSAHDRPKHASHCQELGALCLEKPISQSNLFNTITQALGPANFLPQTAAESSHSILRQTAMGQMRILLVEDNPANQKVALYILNEYGHLVKVANNGREAVDCVINEDFDLVLMDVQMPTMDGFQATAAIRKLHDPKKARLPIVAMTAHAMKGDQERCLAAGMDAYVTKPFKARELFETIERLAGKGVELRANQNLPPIETEHSSEAPSPATHAAVFDLDDAVKHCYGKYDMFQDMVGCLFDEADPLLERMRSALGKADAAELLKASHRLKGTVLYLGAHPALDATGRVEQMGLSGDLTGAAEAIQQLEKQIELLKAAISPHRKTGKA